MMPELDAWVAASGLTARECAMIQPAYSPPEPDPNFRITSISPSTTAATGQSYPMQIQFVGLLDRYYAANSSRPLGYMTVMFKDIYLHQFIPERWATSAT